MKIAKYIAFTIILMACIGCVDCGIECSTYKTFYGTRAWDFAKAIYRGDTVKMGEILNDDPSLLNYCDTDGWSILMHVVRNQTLVRFPHTLYNDSQYSGNPEDNPENKIVFCYLLNKGADVNIQGEFGITALTIACSNVKGDSEYVKLLLAHGAKTDVEVLTPATGHIFGPCTPLMYAVHSERKDYIDLLLSYGADIDHTNNVGSRALSEAMWISHKTQGYSMVLYLLSLGADYTTPYYKYWRTNHDRISNEGSISFVEDLRWQMVRLGSREHKQKMEIDDFLRKNGIDYKKVPIPEEIVEFAKRDYPDSWQEYLDNY